MRYFFLAALAACWLVALPAYAAQPASGTLTAANTRSNPLTYIAGPFASGSAASDTYLLKIDLPPDYARTHPQTYIRLSFVRSIAADSYTEDLQGDTPSGDPLDAATHWATGRPFDTSTDHAYLIPSGGPRTISVVITPGTVSGSMQNVSIALVKIPDDTGNPDLPYAALGNGPRFARYTPKNFPGLGLHYSEPTIGVDTRNGDVFSINTIDVLRTKFDDATTPARETWESRPPLESSLVTLDPILAADQGTGRIFSLNLTGPVSTADYTDDDGATWLPGGNGFPSSGIDHQTLGAGPYPNTGIGAAIPHPLYPNAIYYCSQGVADAYCSRSDDGGVNFDPAVVIYTNTQCTGLHGHVKVAPDGTAYVPNKACNIDFPTFGNGVPGLVVSEDAGVTWTVQTVGTDVTNASGAHGDPSVAIGKDNTVYYSYLSALDGHVHVGVSKDHGKTWFNIFDVGAIAGVHAAQFPAMVAGDAGRAAVAFLGTAFPDVSRVSSSTGGLQTVSAADGNIDFPGAWHGYIATTLDYGAHWFVSQVAPDDIIQGPGGIGGSGDNRNLLDFNDATIDTQGRVLATFADGCLGGCQLGNTGNFSSNTRVAEIVRQTGGPRMLAQFDLVEPAAPPSPRLTGYRTQDYVVLQIDADNGGSPISGYNIARNGSIIASKYPQTTFVDKTANDKGASYSYTATAINGVGESPASNVFAPKVDEGAPLTAAVCTLPGQLWLDQTGEPGAELPESDLKSLGVAEPQDQPSKLVFTATSMAPGGSVRISFDHPNGRRYSILIDVTGTTVTNTDGRWYSDTPSQLADLFSPLHDAPALDSSGADTSGNYTAVLDKAKWGLNTGDVLRNISAQGLQVGGRGQIFLRDFLGYDISQMIVGNDFCQKGAHLPPPVVDIPVTPAPQPRDKTRFGGALPLSLLIGLFGFAALRQRRH